MNAEILYSFSHQLRCAANTAEIHNRIVLVCAVIADFSLINHSITYISLQFMFREFIETIRSTPTSRRNLATISTLLAPRTMSTITPRTKLKAILIDLSGTLHIDDEPTKNAVAALDR